MSYKGAEEISRGLLKCDNWELEILNLEYKNIEVVIAIANILKSGILINLIELNLSHNWIGYDGAVAIAKALRSNNCKLKYFNLKANNIGNDGTSIAESLIRSYSCILKQLNLSENDNIQEIYIVKLIEILESEQSTLEILYIRENDVCVFNLEKFKEITDYGSYNMITLVLKLIIRKKILLTC